MRTATIIRRLAAAAESRSFSSKRWCCYHGHGHGNGHGPVNLFPSMLLVPVMTTSGSFAQGRMTSIESMRSARHISSSSISADTISAPEPDNRILPTGSESGTSDEISRSINDQITALGRAGKWEEILILYKEQKKHFDSDNHSKVIVWMSRTPQMRKDDPMFEAFLDDLSVKLHTSGIAWIGSAHTLATILRAMAKMELNSNLSAMKVMQELSDHCKTAEWLIESGNGRDVADSAWACGKLGIELPNLFRLLDERALWLFEHGNARDISESVWACGKLGIESPNLFRLLDERALWLFEHGSAQDVSDCVWACGKLGIESPNLFRLLDLRTELLMKDKVPEKSVARCIWACGKLEIETPNLFRLLNKFASRLFKQGNPQEIANCVWACGKLGIKSPNLFGLLDQRAEWFLDIANPQEIAICVWACGKLEIKSPNLFRLLDERTKLVTEHGNPPNIDVS